MQRLIVTAIAALALAGCGASQSSSAQLRQLYASFTVAYRAHHASKACSLFSGHGRALVVHQVEEVGGIGAGEPATCENAMRYDFTTGPTVPRLVSVQVNGNRATLNYSGIKGNAVKQNGTWKFDSSSARERQFGALRLLTLATLRLPDVALYGELLHSYAGEPRACCLVAQTLIGAASGAMRLAHRALEMHAVEVGYRTDLWMARAVEGTRDELGGSVAEDEGLPVALEQARLATLALTRATASTANEPMLVPGQIADALAHLLVIYVIAVEVASAA